MENKTIALTAGIFITLALAISGTYILSQDDDAYYCQSRDVVTICDKLSSGIGSRCYFNDTYKICSEGWKNIELIKSIEINQKNESISKPVSESISESVYGYMWKCSQISCVRIK